MFNFTTFPIFFLSSISIGLDLKSTYCLLLTFFGRSIKITGLRSGEKLYEELLIEGNPEQTEHAQILKTFENGIELKILNDIISDIENLCKEQDSEKLVNLLKQHVEGYADNTKGNV